MAIAKIHAIKSTVAKSIEYITNPDKTIMPNGTQLVSSFNCATETAAIEFDLTRRMALEMTGDYTNTGRANNLAYHMIQSFDINDNDKVTPEQIHKLGIEFAEKFLKGKYEYVIATHIDKKHVHNHIIFNAVSFRDYKKFRSQPYKTVAKMREINDLICEENNLSVIKSKGRGKSYKEWMVSKEGLSWFQIIQNKIDETIPKCTSYDEFKKFLLADGFYIKEGKHIAFKTPDETQTRYIRGKRIGDNYTKTAIEQRIAKNLNKEKYVIDQKFIYKKLSSGYLLSMPESEQYLYLASDNLAIESDKEYHIFDKTLTAKSMLLGDNLISIYSSDSTDLNRESKILKSNGNEEIPIEDYIKDRQIKNREQLHKLADAASYSRKQGVVYYSDFAIKIDELSRQAYDTKHKLIDLDKKVIEFKNIGKLILSYEKLKAVADDYSKLKFSRFTRRKFENKYGNELASYEYVMSELKQLSIDPNKVNKSDIVALIKSNDEKIKLLETEAQQINDVIERLREAQSIINEYVLSDISDRPIAFKKEKNTEMEK